MAEIKNGVHLYQVGKKVAEADNYRLYLCVQSETGRQCLLQIAAVVERNGDLQRAAYLLKELRDCAEKLEAEYANVKTDPNVFLNYQLGFPELLDSFICTEQGGRQINVLAFRNVEDVGSMVPLINITAKDGLRVDLRTSAWIMGKLLKLLVFFFGEGFSVDPTESNVLIEPDQHYVVIFDFSTAQIYPEVIPTKIRRREISRAAQAVVTTLGGDLTAGKFPNDGDEAYARYTDYLLRLARGGESNARRAHAMFYEIVDSFWKREFYPFTTKPLVVA